MSKEIRTDRVKFTFRVTDEQYEALNGGGIKKLNRALDMHDEVPKGNFTSSNPNAVTTKLVGGHLRLKNYDKLKNLAETNGLSMSKTVIRLLQLPE